IGVVILGIIAVIVVNNINASKAAAATMQTQVLEKGDLTAIVGATGTVRANQSASLVWQTNGRIESINVVIGDKVKTDEELATLAQSSLSQSIILAQSDLVTAQRNLDELINSDTARAQAQLNLANAQQNYDKVRWNAVYADKPRETSQNTLDSASAAVVIAQDRVDRAQKEYDKYGESSETDLLKANALSNLAAAKKALAEAKLSLNYYNDTPDTKEVSISSGEIAVAKAKLDDAQREWDRLMDGPDPADIEAAKARVAAIEATLNLAKISSPFAGVITDAAGMVGNIVNPNAFAFRVDDLSQMFIDVEIPEVDINRIKVGQVVAMTFDAINAAEYQGKIVEVARIGAISAGAVNFKVTIEVLNPDEQVMPGMTAAVNIVVSDLKDVLTIPNRAVRLVEGKRVVYILKNGVATKVEIEIGSSSDTLSEVISGDLKAGDVLILNPSTDFSSMMSGGRPF
ncbi:MAG: efflux RND transporter periplasmic adaptor subunit, partial [Anaerolineaceae bacterium]|nr:efflux RND transporter periplasmic adaptor subunit [Anaerolineaceae bacterium]